MPRTRKPKIIEVGKCYRMLRWGSPSDRIVYVYGIEGKKQRSVFIKAIGNDELGYNATSYTDFLRSVHSEVPTAKN